MNASCTYISMHTWNIFNASTTYSSLPHCLSHILCSSRSKFEQQQYSRNLNAMISQEFLFLISLTYKAINTTMTKRSHWRERNKFLWHYLDASIYLSTMWTNMLKSVYSNELYWIGRPILKFLIQNFSVDILLHVFHFCSNHTFYLYLKIYISFICKH